MSTSEQRTPGREIARALQQTLEQSMVPGASLDAVAAARNAAQLLALHGLDRLLGLLEQPPASAPPELAEALDRVHAITAECVRQGQLTPLKAADTEIGARAAELLARSPHASAHPASPETVLNLAEVLEDMPVQEPELRAISDRVCLTAPVAAALRAAVDWLVGETAGGPIRLVAEEGLLEVSFDRVNPLGLSSAHQVLASVGGNLGPVPANGAGPKRGKWILRVPTADPRGSYLMVVQGALKLAIPWHAVLRIHMFRDTDIASGMRQLQPVLDPLSPLERGSAESPVILLGHGIKRAYLVADRLIWRMSAERIEPQEPAPAAILTSAVQTDAGDVYWVADPARLLEPLDDPRLLELERAAKREGTTLPLLGPENVEPIPIRQPESEIVDPAMADVPPSRLVPGGAPRALVAESSTPARIFLTRLLEQLGWEVKSVATASEMFAELYDVSWSLVCMDVELADGHGVDVLAGLATRRSETNTEAPFVALVRDEVDAQRALRAGVPDTLRRPYERESLVRLLTRLSLPWERARGD